MKNKIQYNMKKLMAYLAEKAASRNTTQTKFQLKVHEPKASKKLTRRYNPKRDEPELAEVNNVHHFPKRYTLGK